MTYPQTPLPVLVEMYLNSAWTDVTADVYSRDDIQITRGRYSESGKGSVATARLTLDNRTGKYSPRNPSGAYYGQIGRNTPIRISTAYGGCWFWLNGTNHALSTPDSANLSITGDIEIQWDGWLADWRTKTDLVSKYGAAGQRSWAWQLNADGTLSFYWSADGTNLLGASTTTPVMPIIGRKAFKVTLDVNNGAAGRTIAFYTSDRIDGTWTQMDSSVVQAGTTSIFDSTTAVLVGKNTNTDASSQEARVYEARVYNGIAGTLRAAPKASSVASGSSSFSDSIPITWTMLNSATVTNRSYRFAGVVATWPQKWDQSGSDVYAQIECAGLMRRLGRGSGKSLSILRRYFGSVSTTKAYWPLEEGASASAVASGLIGGRRLGVSGTPTFGADDSFDTTLPIAQIGSAQFTGIVNNYTAGTQFNVWWVGNIPSGTPTNSVIARFFSASTLAYADLIYTTGGNFTIKAYTNLGALSVTIGPTSMGIDNRDCYFLFQAVQNGAAVDLACYAYDSTGTLINVVSGTSGTATLGRCSAVQFNPDKAALSTLSVGHIHVSIDEGSSSLVQSAYLSESAEVRIKRLASENSFSVAVKPLFGDPRRLGAQTESTLLELLDQIETSDGGIIFEDRETYDKLVFRTLDGMYSQNPQFTISYADNNLQEFEPVDDDSLTRNKVTASKINGGSETVEQTSGTLGTSTIGTYDSNIQVSAWKDEALKQVAGWQLNLGTVDEARWPRIGVNTAHPDFVADAALTRDVLLTDIGDLIKVSNPPSWLPPDTVQQIVIGEIETLGNFEHSISFVCQPGSVFRAAVFSRAGDRWSNENTTLAGTMTTTSTSRTMNVAYGPLWTTTASDFPFDIMVDGERMTVTNITGSSSPQTFTVTRSVNGVVKAQSSGATVRLYDPLYYGF